MTVEMNSNFTWSVKCAANRTDVCFWKRTSFTVHSQMLGLWISMHPTSVPQTMCNQLSPAFSFMTCHSSRWDNWPSCKTLIGTPVSGSWNVFTDEEENEFQRWFFFVSQQGFLFQAERYCFTEFLSCHDLARTRFCRRVHYNTDLWQQRGFVTCGCGPQGNAEPLRCWRPRMYIF